MAKGFNLTAEINLRGPSNVRQVVRGIRKQLTGINADVNVKISAQTVKQINTANQSFQRFNKTLKQTQSVAAATASSFNQLSSASSQLANNLQSIPQNVAKAAQASSQVAASNANAAKETKQLTSEFAEFGKQSALAVRRFAAFATVTGVIYKVSNAINSATQDFIAFEKELVKVAQVSGSSVSGLGFLVNEITSLSTGLGVASQDLISVSRTLTQAGLSATQTSKALEALAKSALAPTFDDLNRTVEGSVALMRQFGISANQLEGALGSINAVAGQFAVEAGDIITAISRTGGVFASASQGVSQGTDALNEFIAVFTSVRATTRESAETIATGLRTIFTRIQRSDTIDALKAYGVELQDLEGKFVGPYEATRRLAEGLRQLDPRDIRFSRIVEELGGFRQIGKVIPLIQQFTTAQRALSVAQQGQGSLARDAATAQLSLANQIAKVQQEFTALVRSIGQSQGFQDLVRIGLDLSSAFIAVADAAKSALPAITAIFAIKGFKALTQFGSGFLSGIKRGGGQGLNDGGYVHHFARGGVVPGSGNRDTVPAMLQPGEFVIRKKAVEKLGTQRLHKMNKYAAGGKVTDFALSAGLSQDPNSVPKWTKSRGAMFRTTGKSPNRFNPEDEFKYTKLEEPFDVYQQTDKRNPAVKRAVALYDNAVKSGDARGRGRAFEQVLSASGKVSLSTGGEKKGNPRLDGFNIAGGGVAEIKSTAEQVSISNINAKMIGAALDPVGESDLQVQQKLRNNELRNEKDIINLGTVTVWQDKTSGLGKSREEQTTNKRRTAIVSNAKQNNRNLGGYIQAFASGGSAEDTVPAMLTPGEFVINKQAASRIGSQRLNKLNKADRIQGFNKGGAVGRVQRFANGGEVFDFADNIAAVTPAAERAMDDLLASIIAEIAKAKPNISFDDARLEAEKQVGGTFSPGLKQAAEAGDPGAAKAVYQAQRQQVVSIVEQIRQNDKSIPISQARAAAEQKVAAAWGGLVTKTTTLSKVTSGLANTFPTFGSAISKTTNIFRRIGASAQSELGQAFSKFGTVLAFVGTTLADQVGQGIGGTTGAGVSAAGGAVATGLAVGSQFGPYGALVGGIAGAVQAISSYTSAVAKKEAEIAGVQIDQTIKESEQARQSFAKGGADADAATLVANFQKVQQLEQQRVQSNVRAEQPGFLSRGLSFVSGGYLGGDRRTTQEVAGARTADEQMGGAEAQALIASMVDAGKSYKQVSQMLNSQGVALGDLYGAIAEANPAYQQEVAEINKANMAESLKTKAIDRAKKKYSDQARSLAEAEFADKARAQASAKLAKQINIVSASITRTFANLNQSIDSASNGLKNASDEIQRIVSGATGFTANLDSINVLQNPRAFSRQEQNAAISQGAQFAGRDRGFVEQLARFSLDAEDIVASGAARAQQAGPGAAQANIVKDVIDDLTTRLEGALGQNELTNRIRKNLEDGLAEAVKVGDGEIDLQKLLEESGFTKELDFSKQTFDALQKSLKFTQDALNFAASAANEYGKLQQDLRDNQANYQATIIQSDQALQKALGKRVDVRESITGREQVAATRAGVTPQQFNAQALSGRRDVLKQEVDRIRAALQRTSTSFDTAIPGTEARFTSLTQKLAEAESALKATESGLEKLPSVIEGNINDIISEIGRIQQEQARRQDAGAGFAERLVGSTPQELAALSGTFNVLNNALNGQIATIQQSQVAWQAYYQILQKGGTQQEAVIAAQQAYANQTRNAIGLFQEMVQFSGLEGQEINEIKATLLEGFARAQGMGVQNNPIFKSIIEGLRRKPEDNPEIKALTDALGQQQTELQKAFSALSSGVIDKQQQVLTSANQQFIQALNDVKLNFNTAQLREFGLGLGTPGQATGAQRLEKGGVVYASKGKYVNFQPKGTDTVPAMLTPGEFVVNAQAAKNNLGLLRSINSSAGSGKTFSKGGVVYAAGGTPGKPDAQTQDLWQQLLKTLGMTVGGSVAGNVAVQKGGGIISTITGWLQALGSYDSTVTSFTNYAGSDPMKLLATKGTVGRIATPYTPSKQLPTRLQKAVDGLVRFFSNGRIGSLVTRLKDSGVAKGIRGAGRLLGPLMYAYQAYNGYVNAPPGTNPIENAVYSLMTGGSSRGGGDVGARPSTIGSMAGFQRGSYADLATGNLSEFGTAVASGALTYGPAGAVVAGSAQIVGSTARETRGLLRDTAEATTQANRTRDIENTARQSTEGPSLRGFSPAERTWIRESARIQDDINRLEAKNPKSKRDLALLKSAREARDTHEAQRQQVFSQRTGQTASSIGRVFGYEDETLRVRTDAEIDSAVQNQTASIVSSRREKNRKKQQEAADRVKQEQQDSRDEREYQKQEADRIRKEKQARDTRRELGLSDRATNEQVIEAKQAKADRQERIKKDWEDFNRYTAKDQAATRNLKDPFLPPNHEVYDQAYKDALQDRERLNERIADVRASQFSSDSLPPFIRNDPEAVKDMQKKWETDKENKLRNLYEEYDSANTTIVNTNSQAKNKLPEGMTRDQVWEQYRRQEQRQEKVAAFRKRESEKNILPKINRMQMAAYRATSQARNQRQLMALRENFKKNAIAQGIIDPSLDDITNVKRITSYGGGALANFLYGQNAINPAIKPAKQASKGGVIYANQGMLVPYEPKGTDTVPAMLTPGEFVVNRAATQANLPLLKAINNSNGGKIEYKFTGGQAGERGQPVRDANRQGAVTAIEQAAIAEIVNAPNTFDAINASAINEELTSDALVDAIKARLQEINTTQNKMAFLQQKAQEFTQRFLYLDNISNNVQSALIQSEKSGTSEKSMSQLTGGKSSFDSTFGEILATQLQNASTEKYAIEGASDKLKELYQNGQLLGFSGQSAITTDSYNRGGIVYASKGMMVNYQPKGTDTVPAMLTPGEFVVNRAATQANLPLLKAINNGAQGYSNGGVAYRSKGGPIQYFSDGTTQGPVQAISTEFTSSLDSATRALTNFGAVVENLKNAFNQNNNPPSNQNQQNNGGGVNIDMQGLSRFTTKLSTLITQLDSLSKIPTKITIDGRHNVNVSFTGAEALQQMTESFRKMAIDIATQAVEANNLARET